MQALHRQPVAWLAVAALAVAAAFVLAVRVEAQSPGASAIAGVDYVDGQVLVKFRPGTPAAEQAQVHAAAHGRVTGAIAAIGVQVVDVGRGRTLAAIDAYSRNPNVAYAEVNGLAHATYDCAEAAGTFSNDDCSWRQWGLDNTGQDYGGPGESFAPGTPDADVDIPEAWAAGATGSGVIIAVLDTGYDHSHEDLASKVEAAANFTSDPDADLYGHGTWTASIATGLTNNSKGIAGAAPDARLIVGKVLNDSGGGSWSWIANGITWAADYAPGTPTVISMSLGGSCRGNGPFGCQALADAVNYAANRGAFLVAAAGNAGGSTEYPGAYSNVLAVAATDANDAIASFSSIGNVAAPGVNIFGAFPDCSGGDANFVLQVNNGIQCSYDYGSGTSAATPIVAGVAADVWSANSGWSAGQVRSAIENSAQDVPGTSYDGAGRITACGALGLDPAVCYPGGSSSPTPTPTAEPTATPTPAPVPGGTQVSLSGTSINNGSTWTAVVDVAVTQDGTPAVGVTVSGTWSGGASGPGGCTTGAGGTCSFSKAGIHKREASATFTTDSPVSGATVTIAKP